MVPDGPTEPDYPAAWWQVVLLFFAAGLIFGLAALGGIQLAGIIIDALT